MADLAHPWPLRIAFAFGDERLAAHVCEAVGAEAEFVYTAPVSEFDVARLARDRVAAVLLNVDAGDAADALEARLGDANVRVVFNDPESSMRLEGWARARWLRHLMAKLRGDTNVDPPRPDAPAARADVGGLPPSPPVAVPSPVAARVDVPADDAARSERVDASGAAAPAPRAGPATTAPPADGMAVVDAPAPVSIAPVPPLDVQEFSPAPTTAVEADDADDTPPARSGVVANPPTAGDPLDVDTEALSAMIDARLAEADAVAPADDLEATWAIPSPAPALASAPEPVEPTAGLPADAATGGPPEVVVSGDVADSDILANLPSLEDWALVDPDAELGFAPHKPTAAALPEGLGSGLQLLPLDGVAPAPDKEALVKRWLEEPDDRHHADGGKA